MAPGSAKGYAETTENAGMPEERKVGRALARQRRKLMRAKRLIADGMKKKDAASKVGWSAAHLRSLLAEDRNQMEQLQ